MLLTLGKLFSLSQGFIYLQYEESDNKTILWFEKSKTFQPYIYVSTFPQPTNIYYPLGIESDVPTKGENGSFHFVFRHW